MTLKPAEALTITQCAPYPHGFSGIHGSRAQAADAVAQMALHRGWRHRRVDDVGELPADELAAARLVVLFTIGETPWSAEQQEALLSSVRGARTGLVALHSASDACYRWEDYGRLVGGRFDGHPVSETLPMSVLDSTHPATRHLGQQWQLYDEFYLFREMRPDARVLLRVEDDDARVLAPEAPRPADGYPIAWCHEEGQGRVFTTALGHYVAAWESPVHVAHVAGAVRWVLGE